MVTMVTQTCWCGRKFQARAADVKRGWGKYCCKKHAAKDRERKAGARRDLQQRDYTTHEEGMEGVDHDWSPFE